MFWGGVMDIQERFKTEYMLLEVENVAECKEDILSYLEGEATALGKSYDEICGAVFRNKIYVRLWRLGSFILDSLGFDCVDENYFLRDIDALEKYGESIGTYEFLYRRLIASLNDDNWNDIYRLAEFMGDYVLKTDNYYDKVREGIQISYSGFNFMVGGEDETKEFRTFFDQELNKILSKGHVKEKSGDLYGKGTDSRKN